MTATGVSRKLSGEGPLVRPYAPFAPPPGGREQEELAGSNGQGEELTRFYAKFLEEHSIIHGNPT